ncbi:MAG: hypothetical protein H6748_04325 [Spirochaetaceae bacterium]|nr:hypothetical protein [Spirochaetaceae bacterium]
MFWTSEAGIAGGATWSPSQNHAFMVGVDSPPATIDALTGAGLRDSFVTAGQPNGERFAGFAQPDANRHGFTYSPAEGVRWLPRPNDFGDAFVADMSSDGRRIVGTGNLQAVLWDDSRGIVELGDLRDLTPGEQPWSFGAGISADGSVLVGKARNEFDQFEAFRWSAESGMVGLGTLLAPGAPGAYSEASKVSADGSTIVGWTSGDLGMTPFIWTEAAGMMPVGTLAGFQGPPAHLDFEFEMDVSGDGSIVVGTGFATEGAFIFSRAIGLQSLEGYLSIRGLDLGGWHLISASGISEDGRIVVGTGTNPAGVFEGYLVIIPEPATAVLAMLGLAILSRYRRATE